MKFYQFGEKKMPVMMLLPGTCSHWKNNFIHVIDPLTQYFQVVCVSYDGFDETEDSTFPDMMTETEKIESYIIEKHNGIIFAAYGCSLGGSFVGLLIQRCRVTVNHGFIGSSDLDQMVSWKARLLAAIVSPLMHRILVRGKLPGWMLKRLMNRDNPQYADAMLRMLFSDGNNPVSFVTRESVYQQFYSDLVTELQNGITAEKSVMHCLYAKKMGAKYLKRYLQHFANPDIIEHDLEHEELLLCFPDQWVQTLARACGLSR